MKNTIINISDIDEKRNKKNHDEAETEFRTTSKGKKLVCVENTQKLLNILGINVYYDIIKKRSFMESDIKKYNGDIIDYKAIGIVEEASKRNYFISKNTMIDHLLYLARDNSINKVLLYFKEAESKWDGVSRIDDVYNTLNSPMDRKLGLAYFTKWCIQAVRIAGNADGKMNQEFVLVLQGGQGVGKTTWLKMLFAHLLDYFKEGLELRPDNKDCILEFASHFVVELGELDATMKHEQAQLKAFITRSIDEVRKPFERLSERFPRQTIMCATVNEEEFLKDKTGNRRYAIIKTGDTIDRLTHIDLEQFWGEISTLA
ncbi:virulence-associated E family protein, partial [Priestia megaterium]|uniref:virulence-associated E family protein n=1 Tax=Priestia megaterium TaxID=1404 RepID=UPI000C01AE88